LLGLRKFHNSKTTLLQMQQLVTAHVTSSYAEGILCFLFYIEEISMHKSQVVFISFL